MKVITSLILCVLLVSPLNAQALQNRGPRARGAGATARARAARVRRDPARERREKTFEMVWRTVYEENFDPTFGGVNWLAVYSRYQPLATRAPSDLELHRLLQRMVNEIPQSHFAIIPPDKIPRVKSKRKLTGQSEAADDEEDEAEAGEEENDSDNEIATQMLNGVGLDVRVLGGQVVITRVEENGPAAKAGLRPGFVLKGVDGFPLENIPAEPDTTPMLQAMVRETVLVDYLGGEPGTEVGLTYLDAENKEHEVTLKRERLKGALSPALGNLPPMYTELEAKRLPDQLGYIRFTAFTPQLAEKFCGAVKSLRDTRGLVIDLRGNPGGVMGVASGMVGLLTNKTGLIGVLRTRAGGLPIPTFPQKSSYTGPIVVLIDRLSGSTAEVMAAALQESGRAKVVGERSAGAVLGADIKELPTGALFEYARAGFKTSEGATLEGKGVKPDVETRLTRDALLKGEDDQLREAVRQVKLGKGEEQNAGWLSGPVTGSVLGAIAAAVPTPKKNESAPPPPVPAPAPVFKSTPEAERVMERYIKALGGREALERLTSRVSTGVCTYPFQNLTGRVVIYEQAPYKRSFEIDVPNMGVKKFVFDGERGWMQDSMMGFYEYPEPMLQGLKRDFDFHKVTKYRELYSELIYRGAIDTDRGKVEILEVVTPNGHHDEMHFDAQTGLLVYADGTKYGDYRQVGDVKVPFLLTVPVMGLEIKIQLTEVRHNVEVPAPAFAEPQSCFTGQNK
jgi:carboxyl-terminal processing protease